MKLSSAIWLLLRVIFLLYGIYGGFSPEMTASRDWGGFVAIPLMMPPVIIGSLYFPSIFGRDLSDPYSLTKPFFPIGRYPFRAYLVAAVWFLISGGVGLGYNLLFNHVLSTLAVSFFAAGLLLLLGLLAWKHFHF